MSPLGAQILGEAELDLVKRVLQRACGFSLSSGLQQSVRQGFSRTAQWLGVDHNQLLESLRAGEPRSVAALIESSVVCETYFFRHPEQIEGLRQLLLQPTPLGRSLTIWSAGCASGEEPYSLAMALLDAGRAGCKDRVLATDVSARALATAEAGTYGDWSLRRISPSVKSRYLTGEKGRVQVIPAVRGLVTFRHHNLITDPPPPERFDAILCRNVLIYFEPDAAARVLHRLVSALRPDGILILGHAELPLATPLGLEWLDLGNATLLRRSAVDRSVTQLPGIYGQPSRQRSPEQSVAPMPRPALPDARPSLFEQARDAARSGDLARAECLARQAAEADLLPEAQLLLSMTAEARGDLPAAIEAARRALYLDPRMAVAHAMLVALYRRVGRQPEAERARRNAIDVLQGLEDGLCLPGVEAITVGALRRALVPPG